MIAQIGIAVFGLAGAYLVGRPSWRARRWGYLVAIIGQPFWVWDSIANAQWGILLVSVVYTVLWADGLRNNWSRKNG